MNDEKWKGIIGQLKDNGAIEILEEFTAELPEEDGPGTLEVVIFTGPLGKMKFERLTRPIVLDKKVTQSRRIGSEAKIEYKYSDEEFSHKFKAYKEAGPDEWLEIEMDRGPMNF